MQCPKCKATMIQVATDAPDRTIALQKGLYREDTISFVPMSSMPREPIYLRDLFAPPKTVTTSVWLYCIQAGCPDGDRNAQ